MKFFTTSKLSENIHETPEGYLVCLGVSIARTGEQLYHKSELPGITADDLGRIIVTRDSAEVFRPETIKSFEGKSLTLFHPNGFVDPKSWREKTRGLLTNIRKGVGEQEGHLVSDVLVTDQGAIDAVKNGLREVSCGYDADYFQTGIGRAVQKNIVGNHLALVEDGRAGTTCAINDHKGKGSVMTITEKVKALFSKAEGEALKLVTEDKKGPEEEDGGKDAATKTLDAITSALKALDEKVAALKTKDFVNNGAEAGNAAGAVSSAAPSMDERMKKLEDAVAKIVESLASKSEDEEKEEPKKDDKKDDKKRESEDEDGEEKEEKSEDEACGDEDEGEEVETGDDASRIEILAPGSKLKGKDAKVQALKIALSTKDGKSVVERFTNGGDLDEKNEQMVNAVFIGASEILKETRANDLASVRTRQTQDFQTFFAPKGVPTPEELNKKNEEFWSKQNQSK